MTKQIRPLIDNGDGTLGVVLTKGFVATIDECDAELIGGSLWCVFFANRTKTPYAQGRQGGKVVYMHRFIMPGARYVDHIDGNGLNNRRSNLRQSTPSGNSQNMHFAKGKLPFKGVSQDKKAYVARIKVGGNQIRLGSFPTPEIAAATYDAAALLHFGEFAATNASLGLLEQRAINGGSGR